MDSQGIKDRVAVELRESSPVNFTDRARCLRNLEFIYHMILASEDLLHLAIDSGDEDLTAYFSHHLTEETGHAEWLKADLDAVGHEIGTAPQIAVAMVGSVYYLIRNVDACALLGYMVATECFPASLENITALESIHGPEMWVTARYHAENDVSHGADVLEQIDRLPESRKRIVLDCALQTARYMALASHTF